MPSFVALSVHALLSVTQTEPTVHLKKTHRRCDLFLPSRTNLHVCFHSRASVACIIDTIGGRLPEEAFSLMQNLPKLARIGLCDAAANTRICLLPDRCPADSARELPDNFSIPGTRIHGRQTCDDGQP
jgi:hypothetical protein